MDLVALPCYPGSWKPSGDNFDRYPIPLEARRAKVSPQN